MESGKYAVLYRILILTRLIAGLTLKKIRHKGASIMLPFNLPGGGEWLVIIAIIVVLFGGSRAMSSVKDLGKEVYKLKKDVDDLKDEVKVDIIKINDKD